MRFLISVVGLWAITSGFGTVLAVPAVTATEGALTVPQRLAQTPNPNGREQDEATLTLLRFETQHYLVRVYREDDLTYLNVYNKETGFTDLNSVLAYLVDVAEEAHDWRIYANQQGDLEYRAMVNPKGDTALEIRLPDGAPAPSEYGFNATYSFPHIFLGEELDDALSTLEESGWSVATTSAEMVQLRRHELALALKFDPNTQVITYTQLIDPT